MLNYPYFSVHCQWATWSQWSKCSRSCGRGVKSRSRRIVRHARHGGRKCYGSSRTKISCYRRRYCPGMIVIVDVMLNLGSIKNFEIDFQSPFKLVQLQ